MMGQTSWDEGFERLAEILRATFGGMSAEELRAAHAAYERSLRRSPSFWLGIASGTIWRAMRSMARMAGEPLARFREGFDRGFTGEAR